MIELKSKKTKLVQLITEAEYKTMVDSGFDMKRFEITTLNSRPIIPAFKSIEVKKIKIKKDEG
jgi:hypothetical protein